MRYTKVWRSSGVHASPQVSVICPHTGMQHSLSYHLRGGWGQEILPPLPSSCRGEPCQRALDTWEWKIRWNRGGGGGAGGTMHYSIKVAKKKLYNSSTSEGRRMWGILAACPAASHCSSDMWQQWARLAKMLEAKTRLKTIRGRPCKIHQQEYAH